MSHQVDQSPLIPKFMKLYWCRYGWNGGKQICLFQGYQGDGYLVRKWRANSGRWTDQVAIRKPDLLAKVTREEAQKAQVDVGKLQQPENNKGD